MKYITLGTMVFLLGCTSQYSAIKKKVQDQNLFLEYFGDFKQASPKNAVIVLLSNNTFRGYGGCNDYNGTFSMNKDSIHFKINDIGTEVCDEIYKEREYLNRLVNSTNILIKGKKVLFTNKNKEALLVYTK